MGADIKNLRIRIKSVNSTLHLTKAMGLVASSKIRRATEGMLRGREFAAAARKIVYFVCAHTEDEDIVSANFFVHFYVCTVHCTDCKSTV